MIYEELYLLTMIDDDRTIRESKIESLLVGMLASEGDCERI